jgi:ABC-2 type transport system ATP-binding protein
MIKVEGLSRRYGKHLAVADLDFEVGRGEVVGFLGPNGAGKSTTMKILTGTLAPSAGKVQVAGHDLLDEPLAVRRKVGFMPEHTPLYPDMSVRGFLEFVADLKEVPGAEVASHLSGLVEKTGLKDVEDRLVGHLSHGYRKRVGLAQALVGDPEVLILDEPTSGLDPHQIVEIRQLIKGFQGQRTVLLSSHILSEVSATCERVLILDRGRLVGQESAAGLEDLGGWTSPRVVLSWDGDRQGVAEALGLVAGVDDVIVTEDGAEVLIAGNPIDVRPQLVETVLAAGGRLQNIKDLEAKGPSLEDLFLMLTGSGPAKDAPDHPPTAPESEDRP